MLMGPIFRAELLRTARRKRYYMLRVVYGLLLLLLIWARYETRIPAHGVMTIAASAGFAEETFLMFAIVQVVTVLIMIPPLFGGAIADEKQRKTLHYLMASQPPAARSSWTRSSEQPTWQSSWRWACRCSASWVFGGVQLDMIVIVC